MSTFSFQKMASTRSPISSAFLTVQRGTPWTRRLPPLELGGLVTTVDMTLYGSVPGHKRQYSFHLELPGHSLLELSHHILEKPKKPMTKSMWRRISSLRPQPQVSSQLAPTHIPALWACHLEMDGSPIHPDGWIQTLDPLNYFNSHCLEEKWTVPAQCCPITDTSTK